MNTMPDETTPPLSTDTSIFKHLDVSGILLAGVIGMFILAGNARSDESVIRFGMVTDVHYADATARGERHYKQSLPKMIEFIDAMNQEGVAFVIQLGDLVDGVSGYDGILYYTLRGLVQGNDSAYATVDIKADGTIRIAGTGRAESVKVNIKPAHSPQVQ